MEFDFDVLSASPLYRSLLPALSKFQNYEDFPSIVELNQELCIEGIQFVPQSPRSSDFSSGYEPRIYERGEVQTRDQSWHDFFNALIWYQFPKTKKMINTLIYQLQNKRFPNKQRLSAENMLALFDENGAIVLSENQDLLELIRQHRWHELFWQRREEMKQQLKVILFGHGLYEKCLEPFIGITAKALLFHCRGTDSIDATVANYLADNHLDLTPSLLSPLPILGIPGWWAENENEVFYSNKDYFREKISR